MTEEEIRARASAYSYASDAHATYAEWRELREMERERPQ